jgi:hypothetical protein
MDAYIKHGVFIVAVIDITGVGGFALASLIVQVFCLVRTFETLVGVRVQCSTSIETFCERLRGHEDSFFTRAFGTEVPEGPEFLTVGEVFGVFDLQTKVFHIREIGVFGIVGGSVIIGPVIWFGKVDIMRNETGVN